MSEDSLPLEITSQATEQIKHIMQHKGIPVEYGLRIGVRGGGCSASFLLGFDTSKETDKVYHLEEVPIYIDKRHLMYVIGLLIDYEQTDQGLGFTFTMG